MTYSIHAEGLVKRYGDTVALDGIDLAVRTGSVFSRLGQPLLAVGPDDLEHPVACAVRAVPLRELCPPGSQRVIWGMKAWWIR